MFLIFGRQNSKKIESSVLLKIPTDYVFKVLIKFKIEMD